MDQITFPDPKYRILSLYQLFSYLIQMVCFL